MDTSCNPSQLFEEMVRIYHIIILSKESRSNWYKRTHLLEEAVNHHVHLINGRKKLYQLTPLYCRLIAALRAAAAAAAATDQLRLEDESLDQVG